MRVLVSVPAKNACFGLFDVISRACAPVCEFRLDSTRVYLAKRDCNKRARLASTDVFAPSVRSTFALMRSAISAVDSPRMAAISRTTYS